MSELVEIILEDVPECNVISVFDGLSQIFISQGIYLLDIEGELIPNEDFSSIRNAIYNHIIQNEGDKILRIQAVDISVKIFKIPDVLYRILKYDNKYDVDFTFKAPLDIDCKLEKMMNEIKPEITNLADFFKVANYYAGIEPASDLIDCFFTSKA